MGFFVVWLVTQKKRLGVSFTIITLRQAQGDNDSEVGRKECTISHNSSVVVTLSLSKGHQSTPLKTNMDF